MTNPMLTISKEVSAALDEKRPVVALESTIITHGMPRPKNLETARLVESDIRSQGAVPATIAVINGSIHVGLEDETLNWLAGADDVMKLSRADLAFALQQKRTGSTTVAATMMAAQLAGIEVFATGGIGGVHKGAEESFDISADLTELARTNVITVCAGAKAILDINKTMEVLETYGVTVIGFQNDQMPAFWSRDSGIPVPLRLDSPEDIAGLWKTRKTVNQDGGVLVANPVPLQSEIPATVMNGHIAEAVKMAQSANITGKQVTPFMLGKLVDITGGKSLETNIALVRNNARLAAKIACALKP